MGNTTLEKLLQALERLPPARDELLQLSGVPAAQELGRDLDLLIKRGVSIYDTFGGS